LSAIIVRALSENTFFVLTEKSESEFAIDNSGYERVGGRTTRCHFPLQTSPSKSGPGAQPALDFLNN